MNDRRVIVALAALVGLLAGLVVGGWLRSADDAPSAPRGSAELGAPDDGALAELRRELAGERTARLALAAELDQLRWALEQLQPDLGFERAARDAAPGAEPDPSDAAPADAEAAAREAQWFDESAFLDHGYTPDEVAVLRERYDVSKMEELYLRDQAAREGWDRRPRLWRGVQKIRQELRAQIGDEAYDVMLYASGSNNRVRLVDTLATSPAESVNLQAGDVVVRYAGENIYSIGSLHRATSEGDAGDRVAVDVLRDGQEFRVYLPRGPLGARLAPFRSAPQNRR